MPYRVVNLWKGSMWRCEKYIFCGCWVESSIGCLLCLFYLWYHLEPLFLCLFFVSVIYAKETVGCWDPQRLVCFCRSLPIGLAVFLLCIWVLQCLVYKYLKLCYLLGEWVFLVLYSVYLSFLQFLSWHLFLSDISVMTPTFFFFLFGFCLHELTFPSPLLSVYVCLYWWGMLQKRDFVWCFYVIHYSYVI